MTLPLVLDEARAPHQSTRNPVFTHPHFSWNSEYLCTHNKCLKEGTPVQTQNSFLFCTQLILHTLKVILYNIFNNFAPEAKLCGEACIKHFEFWSILDSRSVGR